MVKQLQKSESCDRDMSVALQYGHEISDMDTAIHVFLTHTINSHMKQARIIK